MKKSIIKCDNDRCRHNKEGVCTTDIELHKTWVGSEKYYKLECRTADEELL